MWISISDHFQMLWKYIVLPGMALWKWYCLWSLALQCMVSHKLFLQTSGKLISQNMSRRCLLNYLSKYFKDVQTAQSDPNTIEVIAYMHSWKILFQCLLFILLPPLWEHFLNVNYVHHDINIKTLFCKFTTEVYVKYRNVVMEKKGYASKIRLKHVGVIFMKSCEQHL